MEKLWSSVVKNEVDDLYGGFQANQHISDYTADVHSLAGNRRVRPKHGHRLSADADLPSAVQ